MHRPICEHEIETWQDGNGGPRCENRARYLMTGPDGGKPWYVCGVHRRRLLRLGWKESG